MLQENPVDDLDDSDDYPDDSNPDEFVWYRAFVINQLNEAMPDGLTTEQVAKQTNRDYDSDTDREEVTTALTVLADLKIAECKNELWRLLPGFEHIPLKLSA